MAARAKTQRTRKRRPLIHAAKISEARFRKVLSAFVRDASATETARTTGLSLNSVVAIFRRIRVYFFEAGLFTDIYEGRDPMTVDIGNPVFERDLLEFHFARIRASRGFKMPASEPDYHLAESHWRYDFHVMQRERPDAPVHDMMFGHLLEIIRLCGPIGTKPTNRRAAHLAILRQMDQRIAWLERNAPSFRTSEQRAALKEIRDL